MLVVISDLHLNDGTVCTQTTEGAAEIFFMELEDQIEAAGHRSDGSYVPVTSIDVVLNGDIFDFIRSDKWLFDKNGTPRKTRPWDKVEQYAPIVTEICKDIIAQNKKFLDHFKNAAIQGLEITNPDGSKHQCIVNLHYLVGNHDWMPYVKSSHLDIARILIKNSLGLTQQSFPWKITEWNDDASKIHDICVAHRVYLQHGDQYDEFNYHDSIGRDGSSLGDAIVIELINKFPEEVKRRIYKKHPNAVLPQEFLQSLEELDNVRPSTHTVIFLRMVIDKLTPREYRKIVKEVFYECSKSVADSGIFKRVRGMHWKTTSKMRALNFASQFSPTVVVRLVTQFVEALRSSYETAAANEAYVKNDMCDYVVYGHTHDLAVEGIDLDRNKLPKVYINSATWRPVHKEINPDHKPKGFPYFTQQTMTWVAFFKDGERKGRKYEIWSGKLGE